MLRIPLRIAFLMAGFVSLISLACGSSPAGNTPPSPTADRCVAASAEQLAAIRAGVQGVAAANDVQAGFAVKSSEFKGVWMVAARVQGPGLGDQGSEPGVWAISGAADAPGTILAVNGVAQEFSTYPAASKTDAEITLATDGVADAARCAGK